MPKDTNPQTKTDVATPDDDSPAPDETLDRLEVEPTKAELTETKPTDAEPTETDASSDITPAETETVTPAEPKPLITDPFDYSKTAVTIAYTFLPEDGHPEGRTVLISLHTTGQEPLFSQVPLRERSETLKDAVAELQERYQVYLPERKVQVEQAAAEQAAAAQAAKAASTTSSVKSKVPTKHAEAIQGGSDAVVVAEKRLSLFG